LAQYVRTGPAQIATWWASWKGASVAAATNVDEILAPLLAAGGQAYLGEPVTVIEHSLQAARLAEMDGSAPSLVVAALLHDIGWLVRGGSRSHEVRGAAFLARYFDDEISEPVRLHVPAKRFLCTLDPAYQATLSAASVRTLEIQGGLLDSDGMAAFEAEPYAVDAVALRRYDDRAKVPGAPTPQLDHYRPLVESAQSIHAR
jgi:predicted HD phosphohydrolase